MVVHDLCLKEELRISSLEFLPPPFPFLNSITTNMKKLRNWELVHHYSRLPQTWQINDPLKQQEEGTTINPIFTKQFFSIFVCGFSLTAWVFWELSVIMPPSRITGIQAEQQ